MTQRRHPFPGNMLLHVENMDGSDSDSIPLDAPKTVFTETENLDAAMLLTSKIGHRSTYHRPVIDIDMPVRLVESSPGKHHLMIDRVLAWDEYEKLLDALVEAGIVEPGYVNAAKHRGFTAVRVPWFKKGDPEPELSK